MKIGIDARFLDSSGRGLGRYVSQLIRELGLLDHTNQYIVFINKNAQTPDLPPNFRILRTSIRWYGFAEQLSWPLLLLKYHLDIMHFTHFNVPLAYRRKFIVTIHDLILLTYPTTHASTHSRWYFSIKFALYRAILKHAINGASRIITISEFSKFDIEKHFSKARGKIVVTYEGATFRSLHIQTKSGALVEKPYVLYVGTAYPHKNLEWTIDAFLKWQEKRHAAEKFILVGDHDSFFKQLVNQFKLEEKTVQFIGSVTDEQLTELYQNAAAYIAPSLYEGFGLPAVEALQFGLPVLASTRTAQPEILGTAALYFEPTDTLDFAVKLTRILDDADLRAALINNSKEQIQRYNWRALAEQTKKLYESC